MRAKPGDWLIVQSRTTERHARRALILAVGADGAPPYTVRWTDEDREVIVFPGPDATVVTAEQLAETDRVRAERAIAMQHAISHDSTMHPTG